MTKWDLKLAYIIPDNVPLTKGVEEAVALFRSRYDLEPQYVDAPRAVQAEVTGMCCGLPVIAVDHLGPREVRVGPVPEKGYHAADH